MIQHVKAQSVTPCPQLLNKSCFSAALKGPSERTASTRQLTTQASFQLLEHSAHLCIPVPRLQCPQCPASPFQRGTPHSRLSSFTISLQYVPKTPNLDLLKGRFLGSPPDQLLPGPRGGAWEAGFQTSLRVGFHLRIRLGSPGRATAPSSCCATPGFWGEGSEPPSASTANP